MQQSEPKIVRVCALALVIYSAALAQKIPPEQKVGTLLRVQSGEEYLGTASRATATYGEVRALSVPIVRTDQVYVITGGGIEYIVTENGRPPTHVTVNALSSIGSSGTSFISWTSKRKSIRPALRAKLWWSWARLKSLSLESGNPCRVAIDSSCEDLPDRYTQSGFVGKKDKTVPVTYEATWRDGQYVGSMYWELDKCKVRFDLELKPTTSERLDGSVMLPVVGAKLDKKHCSYSQKVAKSFVWVPE